MKQTLFFLGICGILLSGSNACKQTDQQTSSSHPDPQIQNFYTNNASLKTVGSVKSLNSKQIKKSPWGLQFNLLPPHFNMTTADYQYDSLVPVVTDLISKASDLGVKWARVSINWSTIEDSSGTYHWKYMDTIISGLTEHKIEPYVCVNGGHQTYTDYLPPIANQTGIKKWKKFITTMTKRYAQDVDYWEVWNEPNYPSFWKPEPNAKDYVQLTKITSNIINNKDSEATLLGGSLARVDTPYAKKIFKEGIAEYIDVVTVHPYNAIPLGSVKKIAYPIRTPDYYLPSSNQYSELFEVINAHDSTINLWQAECGYPSGQNSHGWFGSGPWGENIQAKWILRRGLVDITNNAKVSGYFTLWEFKLGGGWKTNYKGLLKFESRKPKQSYHTYQNLTSFIQGDIIPKDSVNMNFSIRKDGSFNGIRTKNIHSTGFTINGEEVFCYWLPWRMQEFISPANINIDLPDTQLSNPVIIDLFKGTVYSVNKSQQNEDKLTLKDLPLTDYPIVVTSKKAVNITKNK